MKPTTTTNDKIWVKPGDIVKVRGKDGRMFHYLVNFPNTEADYFAGAMRISFNSKDRYSCDETYIDPSHFMHNGSVPFFAKDGAWVNLCTGGAAIREEYIVEVVSRLPKAQYARICAAKLSVMMGSYKEENGKIIPVPLTVNVPISMDSFLGNYFVEKVKEDRPKIDPPAKPKEEFIFKEPVISEKKKPYTEVLGGETQERQIHMDRRSFKKKPVIQFCPNPNPEIKEVQGQDSPSSISSSIEEYKKCASNDERIKVLFELFGVSGKICPSYAYKVIFEHKDAIMKKTSIVLTKEEFLTFALGGRANDLRRLTPQKMNCTYANMSDTTISHLYRKCKSLYEGKNLFSDVREKVNLTDQQISQINDMIQSGTSLKKACSDLNIDYMVAMTSEKINRERRTKVKKKNIFDDILANVDSEFLDRFVNEIEELEKASAFVTANKEIGSLIIYDKFDTGYHKEIKDIDSRILKAAAIRICIPNTYVTTRLSIECSDLFVEKGKDFIKVFLIGNNAYVTNKCEYMYRLALLYKNRHNFDFSKDLKDYADNDDIMGFFKASHNSRTISRRHPVSMNESYIEKMVGIPEQWFIDYFNMK